MVSDPFIVKHACMQGPVAGIEIYPVLPAEVELMLFRGGDWIRRTALC